VHLRTLLIHGARSVLLAAKQAVKAGRSQDRLRTWVLETERRCGHNKATVLSASRLFGLQYKLHLMRSHS
jgi:hypothetical protein